MLMTMEQRQWVQTMKEAYKEKTPEPPPPPPDDPFRQLAYRSITTQTFDLSMTAIILANVALMTLNFHDMESYPEYYALYSSATQLFTNAYYVECILKLVGLGVSGYFLSSWNCFDFFLVCTSLLDQVATDFLAQILPLPPMMLRLLRIARIFRMLRLLKRYPKLRDLLMTAVLSFPSFINVGSLLALLTFIYAVLGVQLFCTLLPGDMIDDQRNFRSFSSAVLVLVQCLTGDGCAGPRS